MTSGELKVQYVPTEYQCADILTKALASSRFDFLRSKLTLQQSPSSSLRGDVRDINDNKKQEAPQVNFTNNTSPTKSYQLLQTLHNTSTTQEWDQA